MKGSLECNPSGFIASKLDKSSRPRNRVTLLFQIYTTMLKRFIGIFVLPIFFIACDSGSSKVYTISQDLHIYEGIPKQAADCIAKEFVQSVSDEAIDIRIALIEGRVSDIPPDYKGGDWGGEAFDPELAMERCAYTEIFIGEGSAAETNSISPASVRVLGTAQHPLPKVGYWRGSARTSKQWFALNGADESEKTDFEECRRIRDWEIDFDGANCKHDIIRSKDGVIEFSKDCPNPDTNGRNRTHTRIEYSDTSISLTSVQEVFEPSIRADGPVVRKTIRVDQRWVESRCPN